MLTGLRPSSREFRVDQERGGGERDSVGHAGVHPVAYRCAHSWRARKAGSGANRNWIMKNVSTPPNSEA